MEVPDKFTQKMEVDQGFSTWAHGPTCGPIENYSGPTEFDSILLNIFTSGNKYFYSSSGPD